MNRKGSLVALVLATITCISNNAPPRVLLLFPWYGKFLGGLAMHHLQHQTLFLSHNIYTATFSLDNILAQHIAAHGFPLDVAKKLITQDEILTCCQKHGINIVITPDIFLLPMLRNVAQHCPIAIIYMRHATVDELLKENILLLKDVDVALGVNPAIVAYLQSVNNAYQLNIGTISLMPPFWNEPACARVQQTHVDKETFFKKRFGLQIHNDTVVIAHVANLVPGKNHLLLLKAFDLLLQEATVPVHLICAGDGSLRTVIADTIKSLQLTKYVHLIGSIPDTPLLLQHCDIHALPSVAEGFPLANLEAAYLRKAVVTTHGIGASFLIEHEHTGLLFEAGSKYALAQSLQRLLYDPILRSELGNRAHERVVGSFSNEIIYQKWLSILKGLSL